jgi:hypothetical protein
MSLKQREGEMTCSFMAYFNKELLLVDDVDKKVVLASFLSGLRASRIL